MNIDPHGMTKVNKEEFDKFLKNFPHAKRDNWGNADVWIHPWMGKQEWLAMEMIRRDHKTRYIIYYPFPCARHKVLNGVWYWKPYIFYMIYYIIKLRRDYAIHIN